MLDRANGLIGKTVIHPSHVPVVHALSVVTHEEYGDALGVLAAEAGGGGVPRSAYRNKMNEANPHRAWARAAAAARRGVRRGRPRTSTFVDLLAAATADEGAL